MGDEPVYLNIYDLSDQNSWTYWCGVGIFHSGLEAYGVEYAYGGSVLGVADWFAVYSIFKHAQHFLKMCYRT